VPAFKRVIYASKEATVPLSLIQSARKFAIFLSFHVAAEASQACTQTDPVLPVEKDEPGAKNELSERDQNRFDSQRKVLKETIREQKTNVTDVSKGSLALQLAESLPACFWGQRFCYPTKSRKILVGSDEKALDKPPTTSRRMLKKAPLLRNIVQGSSQRTQTSRHICKAQTKERNCTKVLNGPFSRPSMKNQQNSDLKLSLLTLLPQKFK
jgi:hypothetical protein